jgi:hypothetical protein
MAEFKIRILDGRGEEKNEKSEPRFTPREWTLEALPLAILVS